MKALACTAALVLVGASAQAAERIYTPEGWYQIEDEGPDGSGEEPLAVIIVEDGPAPVETQAPPPTTPPAQAEPQQPAPGAQPDTLAEEIERFRQRDCLRVRGLYLKRILELHGLDVGLISPEALAALTFQRPQQSAGSACFGGFGCLPYSALAPLYGEPPIPPGALTYDLELQGLFRDLLECQRMGRDLAPQQAPPPQQQQQQRPPEPTPSKSM